VQNEPAAGFPDALLRTENLGDLDDAGEARANLDVYSRAQVAQRAPAGLIGYFARNTAPAGWLKANGAEVSRTAYAELFNAIGTTFGAGNGVDTFNLPDLRGEFLRGWDNGRGVDGGRGFATAQGDELKSHTHDARDGSGGDRTNSITNDGGNLAGQGNSTVWRSSDTYTLIRHTGGNETRPRNVALLACIKY